MRYLLILFLAGPIFSQNNPKQFLFVGNSLTYTNNLPKIFENVAANFNETINTKSLCYPNYALEDHWEEGKLQKLINTGTYDYIIVQQGPSSQNEGKLMLIDYGKKIKALCSKKNSQLVFFMVWPSKYYANTFDGVIQNYLLASQINKALVSPAGEVWKAYELENNLENLYGVDGFHPSKTGSFLSALTLFKTIYPDKNLEDLSFQNSKTWVADKRSYMAIIALIDTITSKQEHPTSHNQTD